MKKHLRYLETDNNMIELCNLYCRAKPWLWRLFFGWYKTNSYGAYFKLTEKQHDEILRVAKELTGYEIL
jgi:hypothetical protein